MCKYIEGDGEGRTRTYHGWLLLRVYLYISICMCQYTHTHTPRTHTHTIICIYTRACAHVYMYCCCCCCRRRVCVLECVRVCTDRPVVGVVQSAHCVIFENRVVFVCTHSHGCVRTIPIQDGKVTLLLRLRLFICIYRGAISAAAVFLDRPSPTAASRQDIVTFV